MYHIQQTNSKLSYLKKKNKTKQIKKRSPAGVAALFLGLFPVAAPTALEARS